MFSPPFFSPRRLSPTSHNSRDQKFVTDELSWDGVGVGEIWNEIVHGFEQCNL